MAPAIAGKKMSGKILRIIFAVGIAAGSAWYLWPTNEAAPRQEQKARTTQAQVVREGRLLASWPPAFPAASPEPDLKWVPLLPLQPAQSAIHSLADARVNGDPRSAPIVYAPEQLATASPGDLAEPEAYQRFEAQQHSQLLTAFTQAANSELPKLQENIDKGRAQGIAPELIAKAEEKARRIAAMRDQLLKEHPESRR